MIPLRDELNGKKIYELRSMITKYGASWRKTEKKTELIERLLTFSATTQPSDKRPPSTLSKPNTSQEARALTEEQVRAAIARNIGAGLLVNFSQDAKRWHFRYKEREDSGSMVMPLEVVKRCADMLVRPIVTDSD